MGWLARNRGTSVIETLVVLTIMMVLLTLLVPALTRAVRMAKSTAAGEEMRQENIGRKAAEVHEGPSPELSPEHAVELARTAFRQENEKGVARVSSHLLFIVRDDLEFRAYWNTLLNPENTTRAKFTRGGALIAFTPEGKRFELPHISSAEKGPACIISWEFISTILSETGRGDFGGNVMYSDGRREYVRYPSKFPMTRGVAELSHRFYVDLVE